MSCGVAHRHGLEPALRLWHRPAAAALIPLLAWEPPHALGGAQKMKKKKKKKRKNGSLAGYSLEKAIIEIDLK